MRGGGGAGRLRHVADPTTLDAYAQHASHFLARDATLEASPLAPWFRVAFRPGSRVVDVGAGSGREVLALVREGYDAWGVEPVESLRRAANERVGRERVVDGALPGLPEQAPADGLVCSAVLQHLPPSQLFDAVLELRGLLKPGGRALVSVPRGARDDVRDGRDPWQRLFSDVRPEQYQLLFERVGFATLAREDSADAHGRPGVAWTTFLFELPTGGAQRPVDQLASVIGTGERKVATYKLALLRALNDLAMTQPHAARWRDDGSVAVPVEAIAERWVGYYWRLFDAPTFLPQHQADRPGTPSKLAFAAPLRALQKHYARRGGLAVYEQERRGVLDASAAPLHQALVRSVRTAIFNGPVTHAGATLSGGRLFSREGATVVVPGPLWRELSLLGHWIGDALLVRWAELIGRFAGEDGAVERALPHLLPPSFDEARDTRVVREVFQRDAACVWTDKPLTPKVLHIDHVLPWSLWHNNDLWNLVPASKQANLSKSDQLPERRFLKGREGAFKDTWARTEAHARDRFRREAAAQLGRNVGRDEDVLGELFEVLCESVERTRLQRGLPAWTPARAA